MIEGKHFHQSNWFLAALEPDDFAWLAPHMEIVDLPKAAVLSETDEALNYAYFPHDAVISLVAVMKDGGSAAVGLFGREAMVGVVTTVATRQSFGRCVVHFPGATSRIAVERMHEAIRRRPAIRHLFLNLTEAVVTRTLRNAACNAVHTVEARCCRCLLGVHDRVGRDTLPLTHEILAEMLGVQRSTVSVVLRSLQTAGYISQGRGTITVTDRAGLEGASCEC